MTYRALALFALVSAISACSVAPDRKVSPENALEREIAVYQKDPSRQDEFEAAFLNSRILIRVDNATLERMNSQSGEKYISFFKFKFRGRETVPVYTSVKRLGAAVGVSPYVVLSGREVLSLTRGLDVCINCGLVPATIIPKADVERILDSSSGRKSPALAS